jgi:CspA family cold shock protein
MPTGTVKWYSREKGFGFIQPDDGSKDVLAEKAELERAKIDNLPVGAKCSYAVDQKGAGATRPRAVDIKLL